MANWAEQFGGYADVDWPDYFQNMIQAKQGQGGQMAGAVQGGAQVPQGGQAPQGAGQAQGYQGFLPEGMPQPAQAVQQADQFMQMIPQVQQMMPQAQQMMAPTQQLLPQAQGQPQAQYQPQGEIQFMAPPVNQPGRIDESLVSEQAAAQTEAELQATIAEEDGSGGEGGGGGGAPSGGGGGSQGQCPSGQEWDSAIGACVNTAQQDFKESDQYFGSKYPGMGMDEAMQAEYGDVPTGWGGGQ